MHTTVELTYLKLLLKIYLNLNRWGRTSGSGTQPIPTQFLRTLRSPIITNISCRIRFPAYITASNLCTDAILGTPCQGDQGSPLMIVEADGKRTQVGVFSYQFSLG